MARKPRVQYAGAFYHVMSRGNRQERIVHAETDYGMLNKTMLEAMCWSGVKLYSWCLMPNHIHILVETPDGNLAEFMQRWLTRYAQYFNWRHGMIGHVFQGRYKAKLCQKEAYFKQLIRYIHLNPYKANITDEARPLDWKWSSHRYFRGQSAPAGCQKVIDEALSWFGSSLGSARAGYVKFLADGLRASDWEDFYKEGTTEVLGDKSLQERFRKATEDPQRDGKERPLRWTLNDVVRAAERRLQVTGEELASASQRRRLSQARKAIAYVARIEGRIAASEIAKIMRRDVSAVCQMLKRMDGRPCREVERIKEALTEVSNCQA